MRDMFAQAALSIRVIVLLHPTKVAPARPPPTLPPSGLPPSGLPQCGLGFALLSTPASIALPRAIALRLVVFGVTPGSNRLQTPDS